MGIDLAGGLVAGVVVGALFGALVYGLYLAIEKGIPRLGRWLLSKMRGNRPPDLQDSEQDA